MDINNKVEQEDFHYLSFQDFLKNFILLKEDKRFLRNDDREKENEDFFLTYGKSNCLHYLVNDILNHNVKTRLYRRVYWPLLLQLYHSTDLDELIKEIKKKRNGYKQDKEEYITKPNNLDIQKLDPQIFHPLCSDDKNPWILKQKNQELKDEIKQDILRTHSDKSIFQNENIQAILNEILFVWAKKNPLISYKQGMNEILAIFFIINYRERADPSETLETIENIYSSNFTDDTKENREKYFRMFRFLFDKDEIEADTFILFDHFLQMGAKYLFSSSVDEKKPQISKNTCKTVLIQKCTHIFHKILKNSDKMLYNHLISLSIEPQIFLLRWVRLLYCREFQIEDVIILWDYFFSDCYTATTKNQGTTDGESLSIPFEFKGDSVEIAHKTSEIFPLVDYFSISMILFIRSFLLENDETSCLKRLFKYPPVENIRTLIDLAFKIKYRNEKKEKGGKKDELLMTNKTNGNTAIGIDGREENVLLDANSNGTLTSYVSTGSKKLTTTNFNSNIKNPSLSRININDYKLPETLETLQYNDNALKKSSISSNLNIFEINEDVKKEKGKRLSIGSNSHIPVNYQLHNSNNINDNLKQVPNDSNFNFNLNLNLINNKLKDIINNLNVLSINLTDEQQRMELQENILQLNGIKNHLNVWEKNEKSHNET